MSAKDSIHKWFEALQPEISPLLENIGIPQQKPDHSPVTEADRRIEQLLREKIQADFPEDGIIGEELPPHQPQALRQWIIDPIDGTRAMIAGFPTFTTLIALLVKERPEAAGIFQPITGELWLGDGKTATYNGHAARIEVVDSLEDAVFTTTSPLLFRESDKPRIEYFMHHCNAYQLGGDAYAYGKLACGRVHLIIESGMKPYDFLPLVPIVQGAGGLITDWEGNPLTLYSTGDVIAAATPQLHQRAIALLNS